MHMGRRGGATWRQAASWLRVASAAASARRASRACSSAAASRSSPSRPRPPPPPRTHRGTGAATMGGLFPSIGSGRPPARPPLRLCTPRRRRGEGGAADAGKHPPPASAAVAQAQAAGAGGDGRGWGDGGGAVQAGCPVPCCRGGARGEGLAQVGLLGAQRLGLGGQHRALPLRPRRPPLQLGGGRSGRGGEGGEGGGEAAAQRRTQQTNAFWKGDEGHETGDLRA